MKRHPEGGFTLIEVVFGAVIMALMVIAVGQLLVSNLSSVTMGKARAIALSLATEKMEHLRDLPYDSLATQNGAIYPPGNLLDTETVVRNNYRFSVKTEISYVDDPYDGYISCPCTGGPANGKPKDLYPYDYKKAQINVTLISNSRLVAVMTTDIAGKAAETNTNTGILSVKVVNAQGQPVPNATVTVVNTNPNPDVNITTNTDNAGLVVIPGLPPDSANRYQVTASLAGYSTEGTIPDPPGAQVAVKVNPNILVQQITSVTLAIDQLSTLHIAVKDTSGNPVSGLNVTTRSTKKTKTNPDEFKYSAATATNAAGEITLTGMEWGSYSFVMPAGYYLVTTSPYAPVALDANGAATANLTVTTNSAWPRITSAAPNTAATGAALNDVVVTGVNFGTGTAMELRKSGETAISGTGCTATSTTVTCDLNLVGAATGDWDLVVTRSGNPATQTGGFSVTP